MSKIMQRLRVAAMSSDESPPALRNYELKVCTNKTCRRQGSQQVAKFAQDLSLPSVSVEACGCLGSCGHGPNMALVPTAVDGSAAPMLLHHVSTAAALVEALVAVAGVRIDAAILKATELRLAGNAAALDGQLQRAVQLYSEALDVAPRSTWHMLLSNRSAAQLAAGNAGEALVDAKAAVACAPPDFTVAAVRQADALFALLRYEEAQGALQAGAQRHPPFGRSADYKSLMGHIQRALQHAVES